MSNEEKVKMMFELIKGLIDRGFVDPHDSEVVDSAIEWFADQMRELWGE